ncbi:50S ribosomal protein L25/general stress protein Ctc [Solemya velesiana gill symbiont]|uniref:Large ribosomal subunit protein bL25 n=1 Tax=Solemya velesiana gill symbiont TaxID=1918948 RepID=A0A1T2KY94_9GAMM|nr:50S ribosomal protein L25/general stress protein Ctc [Solemya velesiana gill symbiont]OOZ37774.1 50S ribosomal protein L25/general stress protein Ctc [Solemya velesiana gill symbiont]
MSDLFEIEAQPRSDAGKGASRRLRRTGQVPGILYGAHQDPEMISVGHNELIQHLEHEVFYSHILSLKLDGKEQQVILKDLQRHPAKPFVTHVDFLRVSADEKIKTHVPVHFINEDTAPGVKMGGAVSHHITDLEVSCLPKDLPEFIEVDMDGMEIGDIILMSGVALPEGVELPALASGAPEHDLPVVSVHGAHAVEEEEEMGAAEGEAEGEE